MQQVLLKRLTGRGGSPTKDGMDVLRNVLDLDARHPRQVSANLALTHVESLHPRSLATGGDDVRELRRPSALPSSGAAGTVSPSARDDP